MITLDHNHSQSLSSCERCLSRGPVICIDDADELLVAAKETEGTSGGVSLSSFESFGPLKDR